MAYYGDNGPFAWVSMSAHNTASINDSFGVSSVSRIQSGTHQVNFSSFSSNNNYCVVGENGNNRTTWADGDDDTDHALIVLQRSSSSCRMGSFDMDDGLNDDPYQIYAAFYSTSN